MKKVIKLTESDLTKIVERVISEETENDDVKKLISLLVNNDLIDMDNDTVNVYDDHIEVYHIKGHEFPYFEDNYIKLHPEFNDDESVVFVEREDYEDYIDDEQYEEVISHIWSDWEDKLDLDFIE